MAQIPVVYGEGKIEENSWHFVVDMGKGGRMWFLNDGCTLGELTDMARDDYNLVKKTELIELTYALPVSMLQTMAPDTPPMHVTNDRLVSSLIALSRVHMVRLCVSSRVEMDTEENQEGSDEDLGEESEENSEHSTDNEADSSDVNEDGEDVDDAAYSDGEDYSVYGKVKDEDDGEDEVCIENVRNRYGETGSTPMSWSDNIYVRASFPIKEKLLSEVRLTAIMLKFAFKTQKSTKTLFVAKCRVEGCAWMVRASMKNDASTFWVTKYVKDHTCSIAHRMAQRGKSTPKYIGKLFISHWGIIDGLTPEHVRVSMKHMFGIKMDYTTSYRSLIYAQQLVRGTPEDGYSSLPAYLHSVNKANPGTVSALHYMRRVIVVDGCHLTGKYEGTLLVATAQDGNFQIFPLAFGIVDGEDDASWEWFFSKLRECVSDGYPLVIVSDRHLSIKKACQTIFPWAKRGICYYHLQHNIGVEYLLAIRGHYADAIEVDRIDTWRFYVKGGTRNRIVDLEHGMCECGVFYIEKIPCSHAIAVALAGPRTPNINMSATRHSPQTRQTEEVSVAIMARNCQEEKQEAKEAAQTIQLLTMQVTWSYPIELYPLKMSNQINFNSLPSDILWDILLKITSRSYDSIQEGFELIKVSSNGGCLMATYSMVMFSLTMDGSHDVFNHIRVILPAEATKMRKTMQHINRCPTTFKKPDAFHEPVFHVFAKAQSRSCACMNLPNQHWMDDESLVDSYGDKLCSPCFRVLECAIFWKTIPGFANEWPR
ncbi:hypothetical protein EUTSA_v10017584mg [Eutrema salsugineum]|uniref:SWIM-type domain-containing protein n=1 Tax=Eutrema salsugineum TaxID=72664 RepID=V4LKW1_EUTSA|nr:hypothetical protein EUTSA_v10017584mg [Eutrema salsugineum]